MYLAALSNSQKFFADHVEIKQEKKKELHKASHD